MIAYLDWTNRFKILPKNPRHAKPDIKGRSLNVYSEEPNIRVKNLVMYKNKIGALCWYFKGLERSENVPSTTFSARLRLSKNRGLLDIKTKRINIIDIAYAEIRPITFQFILLILTIMI